MKEVEGERWTAPSTQKSGRYLLRQRGGTEVLAQSDDLLELLRWAEAGAYEILDDEHRLMAVF